MVLIEKDYKMEGKKPYKRILRLSKKKGDKGARTVRHLDSLEKKSNKKRGKKASQTQKKGGGGEGKVLGSRAKFKMRACDARGNSGKKPF